MTLTLKPDTEARLRAVAAQRGLAPEAALDSVLAEAQASFDEAVAGIRCGMADAEAGDRGVLLEDYRAGLSAKEQIPAEAAASTETRHV